MIDAKKAFSKTIWLIKFSAFHTRSVAIMRCWHLLILPNYRKTFLRDSPTTNLLNVQKKTSKFNSVELTIGSKFPRVFILIWNLKDGKFSLSRRWSNIYQIVFFVCVDNLHVVQWCECWKYGTCSHASWWWWWCLTVFAKATNINLRFHKISLRHSHPSMSTRVRVAPWWLEEL